MERVAKVANQQGFFSSGVKEFKVRVTLDSFAGLRPGFSCRAEIITDTAENVVHVPIQAVFRDGEGFVVYDTRGAARKVGVGISSITRVQVIDGIKAGDELLHPARWQGRQEAMIRLVQVSKDYIGASAFRALKDVQLHIPAGEAVAITGPSGSGKTTLLHLMGLIHKPTTGRVEIGGRDTRRCPTTSGRACAGGRSASSSRPSIWCRISPCWRTPPFRCSILAWPRTNAWRGPPRAWNG